MLEVKIAKDKEQIVDTLARGFAVCDFTKQLQREDGGLANDAEISLAAENSHFAKKLAHFEGCFGPDNVYEAGDYSVVGLLAPLSAGKKMEISHPPGLSTEYPIYVAKQIERFGFGFGPGQKKYYHLHLIARHPNRPVPGAVSTMMRDFIRRCEQDSAYMILEAVIERPREIYEHFGFKVWDTAYLFPTPQKKEGFVTYFMVYTPVKLRDSDASPPPPQK